MKGPELPLQCWSQVGAEQNANVLLPDKGLGIAAESCIMSIEQPLQNNCLIY